MRKKDGPLRWGILSTGHIAHTFAQSLEDSRTGRLVAVGSRTLRSARAFAKRWKAARAYGSYGELLDDPQVEALYIAPPHPFHAPWSLKALQAGKHVLCEKPLAMDYRQALRVVEAARRHKVFLMEAFMYRFSPQTRRLVELVRRKAVGEVRFIRASFCFEAALDLKGRLFNPRLGGGGILDVGCYPLSMARLLAGAALGRPFAEPLEVAGVGVLGKKSRVDEWAAATLKFPGGILAELSCGIRLPRRTMVEVQGSLGTLTVSSPWFGRWKGSTNHILLQKKDREKPLRLPVHNGRNLYTREADAVAECLARGKRQCPSMTWQDTLGNMKVLDRWRKAAGLS